MFELYFRIYRDLAVQDKMGANYFCRKELVREICPPNQEMERKHEGDSDKDSRIACVFVKSSSRDRTVEGTEMYR